MIVTDRPRHRKLLLGGLLIFSSALRLGWALSRPVGTAALGGLPDQLEYLALGRNLLHAGTLCFFDARFGQTVWAYRMPGYPAFIAACGGNLWVVRAMQAVIDTSTVLAVYLLARRVLPAAKRGGPMLAAAMVACNPFLIYFTGLVLSETLFTAMVAWGMLLLIARPNATTWWSGVLLLCGCVSVRPEAVGLAPLLVVSAGAMNCTSSKAYKWCCLSGVVCVLTIAAMLVAWESRNARILGRSVWLTTNGGITLYDGNHPGADGSSNQQAFLADMPQLKTMDEPGRDAYLSVRAWHFIEHNPGQFVVLAVRKFARTWSPRPLSDTFASRGNVAVALAYTLPFDVLVFLGLISSRLPWPAKVFLLMPAIYLTGVHVLTVGSLRYRIPAEAPMAILAAVVLSRMLPGIGEPGRPRPGPDGMGTDRGGDAPALR